MTSTPRTGTDHTAQLPADLNDILQALGPVLDASPEAVAELLKRVSAVRICPGAQGVFAGQRWFRRLER